MAVIGGFRSDLSIKRKTELLETFSRVFCFPESRINENGGNFAIFLTREIHKISGRFNNSRITNKT